MRGPVAGGDDAYLAGYLAAVPGPIILVGHSYWLYPRRGRSQRSARRAAGQRWGVQGAPNPPYTGFAQCFATGVPAKETAVLQASQRPLSAIADPSGVPAWKTIPSWSLIGTQDRVIPPTQQEAMSSNAHAHVETFDGGDLGLITHPDAVVKVILDAVNAAS